MEIETIQEAKIPKVSVIIPVYGVEKYIEQCARSLFEQTLDDIEYLFIDDCTPDGSIGVLKGVLEEYPHRKSQVTIHRMEQNSGQAAVRNYGVQHAKGGYVIHCDTDDWVDIHMYEKLYSHAKTTDADIVICDYYKVSGGEIQIKKRQFDNSSKKALMTEVLTSDQLNTVWNALVRRQLYKNILYPVGAQAEDKTYMIQLIWQANRVEHICEPLYYYRDNPASISNAVSVEAIIKRYWQYKNNQDVAIGYLEKQGLLKIFKKQIEAYKITAKLFLYYNYNNRECRELWDQTYPEIKYSVLFNKYVILKVKILYFLTFFNIVRD